MVDWISYMDYIYINIGSQNILIIFSYKISLDIFEICCQCSKIIYKRRRIKNYLNLIIL